LPIFRHRRDQRCVHESQSGELLTMAIVLVGFIGKGRSASGESGASHTGYVRTVYTFPSEESLPVSERTTSLFSAALLERLLELGRPVARWVVMGTAQSMWDSLLEAIHVDRQ